MKIVTGSFGVRSKYVTNKTHVKQGKTGAVKGVWYVGVSVPHYNLVVLVSVKAGKVAVCQGVKVLFAGIFGQEGQVWFEFKKCSEVTQQHRVLAPFTPFTTLHTSHLPLQIKSPGISLRSPSLVVKDFT